MRTSRLSGISCRFRQLSPTYRQVAHVLLTRPPLGLATLLSEEIRMRTPLDLHVLGTPPAFVLSQDQTLHSSSMKELDSLLTRIDVSLVVQFSRCKPVAFFGSASASAFFAATLSIYHTSATFGKTLFFSSLASRIKRCRRYLPLSSCLRMCIL